MFALDSVFVAGRPSSRLPHVVFRWKGIDLFVFRRLPQFSNNFTSRIESGPGLAFEWHGFRKKSDFLDQPGSRIDCVCHWRSSAGADLARPPANEKTCLS